MILTNIVSKDPQQPKDQSKNDLIQGLNSIKFNLEQQIKAIDNMPLGKILKPDQ